MRLFSSERIIRVMDRLGHEEGDVIQHSMITRSIERAQKKVEENNFGIRKRLLEYDDVMNSQRTVIYKQRRQALLGERIGVRIGLSVACAVLGVFLLALAGFSTAPAQQTASADETRVWLGHGSLLGAVLCEAVYSIIGKKLTTALSAKRITALINLWGFVLSTPFGLYLAVDFDFSAVSASMWLLFLFYSLAASVGSVWLWMTGLHVIPAGQAGIFTVFLPASTALTGVFVLGERLSTLQWLALAVALLGVILATAPTRAWRGKSA